MSLDLSADLPPPVSAPKLGVIDRMRAAISKPKAQAGKATVETELVDRTRSASAEALAPKEDIAAPALISTRQISLTPLQTIDTFEFINTEELKEVQRKVTDIKTRIIACKILTGVAIAVAVLGASICVFCAPAGALMIAGGVALGFGVAYKTRDLNLSKSQAETLEIRKQNIDKALKYMEEDYPATKPNEDDPSKPPILQDFSFEGFMKGCPHTYDPERRTAYRLEDLGTYLTLFEKEVERREKEANIPVLKQQITTLEKGIANLNIPANIIKQKDIDEAVEKCLAEITSLAQQNLKIDQDNKNAPASDPASVQKKEANDARIAVLQQQIEDLRAWEQPVQSRDAKKAQIQKLGQEIDVHRNALETLPKEIEAGKGKLQRHIETAKASDYSGVDMRNNQEAPELRQLLNQWKQKPVSADKIVVHLTADPAKPAIYTFGHLADKPHHAMMGSDPEPSKIPGQLAPDLHGEYLRINDERYRELGRTSQNDFLSNSYVHPIEINGENYSSVTHYLLMKKIDKLITGSDPKTQKALTNLREKVANASTAKEAVNAAKAVMKKMMHPAVWNADGMFSGMDTELKTALFHKFVGPDGKLTMEGQKLLDTGNTRLYAGNESGDASYGLQFLDHNRMYGNNKLGTFLEELRGMLQQREDAANPAAAPAAAGVAAAVPAAAAPPTQAGPAPTKAGPAPATTSASSEAPKKKKAPTQAAQATSSSSKNLFDKEEVEDIKTWLKDESEDPVKAKLRRDAAKARSAAANVDDGRPPEDDGGS